MSWNPESQVTQWGGLAYFASYLKTSGLFDRLVEDAPFRYTSPNAPEVRDVVGTTVLAIVCGFSRYVHINRLRNDTVLAMLLGLDRIVCEDSVRRALKSADERELDAWLSRHEKEVFGQLLAYEYVLDIDNTVKPIFGHQEGAELEYNPQKPGRPSHNFHPYFIGSIRISLGVDVQPGKRHSGGCGMPLLWEIVDGLPAEKKPCLIRGDVGYGGDENMCEAERRGLRFLFKIRRTKTVLSLFRRMENDRDWIDVGAGWEAKETVIQLSGWERPRRCILLRRPSKDVKRIAMATQPRRRGRPKKNAPMLVQGEFDFVADKVGRYWDCCALVTNDEKLGVATLSQVYRDRDDCENNFDEYKNQYGWRVRDERSEAVSGNRASHRHRCQLVEHLLPIDGRRLASGADDIAPDVHGRRRAARQRTQAASAPDVNTPQGRRDSDFAHADRRGEFMRRISAIAEQLDYNRVWKLIILAAFRKWLGRNRAKGLLPKPLAVIV